METVNKYLLSIFISISGFFLVNTYSDYKTLIKTIQDIGTQQVIIEQRIKTLNENLKAKEQLEKTLEANQELLSIRIKDLEVRFARLEKSR